MRIYELPGTIIPPHTHMVDEHLTVLRGDVYFGIGDKFDRKALKKVSAGGYAFFPKGTKIFGYVPGDAVVQIDGVGPFHPIQWLYPVSDTSSPDAAKIFKFKVGDVVKIRKQKLGTRGKIRLGLHSGEITQYEVVLPNGKVVMASEEDLAAAAHES